MIRHLISLADLSSAEIERIFAITQDLKAKFNEGLREPILPGRVLALLFEKPSLRTRVSFEAGMIHLGGKSLFLGEGVGWGSRESIADFARVLGQYADAVVVRTKRHQTALDLAKYADCCVINGLTDEAHPCQAMADLYTLRELIGRLHGLKLAYVGDANNVARSLAIGCGLLGMRMAIASPPGYEYPASFLELLRTRVPDLELQMVTEPAEAVRDAVAVYTDVWTSMGQEEEEQVRVQAFRSYQVNAALMAHAPGHAYFMHCLPAHRGMEVTDEVIDGPNSIVMQQAANRMHVQKGILAWLLGPQAHRTA